MPRVNQLMSEDVDEDLWLHLLREDWRNHLWCTVSTDRSQHNAGAGVIDRECTMMYYKRFETKAETQEDARAKLGLLRRIFAGGLLKPEREAVARDRMFLVCVPAVRRRKPLSMYHGVVACMRGCTATC